MDLLSPSKDFEMNVDYSHSPYFQRSMADNHTGLTPGISQLQPSRAKRARKLSDSSLMEERFNIDEDIDSPIRPRKLPKSRTEPNISESVAKDLDSPFLVPKVPKTLFENKSAHISSMASPILPTFPKHSSDLRPCKLFSKSPQLSPADFEAMMDEIDVPSIESSGSEVNFIPNFYFLLNKEKK